MQDLYYLPLTRCSIQWTPPSVPEASPIIRFERPPLPVTRRWCRYQSRSILSFSKIQKTFTVNRNRWKFEILSWITGQSKQGSDLWSGGSLGRTCRCRFKQFAEPLDRWSNAEAIMLSERVWAVTDFRSLKTHATRACRWRSRCEMVGNPSWDCLGRVGFRWSAVCRNFDKQYA